MNVEKSSEEGDLATATDPAQVMGLYQKLSNQPYNRTLNVSGIAFKTTNELLYGTRYDSTRTRALNLPPSVNGAAFRAANGKHIYVLWGISNEDKMEWRQVVYNFPNTLGINQLHKRNWDFTQTKRTETISSQNLNLNTAPVFLLEDTATITPPLAYFLSDAKKGCPPQTVNFTDSSALASSYAWQFDGGNPTTSTLRNPSVSYTKSGKYDVVLEVKNSFGTHRFRRIEHVLIDSTPKARFSYQTDATGLLVSFTNLSTNSFSMIWDFGYDTTQNFSFNPQHRFPRRDTFRVRLIAFNDCGRDTFYLTLNLRGTATKDPQSIDFQLFPNPFSDNLTLNFNLSEAKNLTLRLFDTRGVLVETLSEKRRFTEGGYSLDFQPKNLADGVYFLQIEAGNKRLYKKIVRMK
jgi:PKD repeat protein